MPPCLGKYLKGEWVPFSSILGLPTQGPSGLTDGIGAKFDRLLGNIELTSIQKNEASTRHSAVRANLEKEFVGARTFVVGSYGKSTAIRPPSDLDIMLVLPESMYQKYSSFDYIYRNAQSELLQEVKRRIQKYYPYTDMKADGQVIIIKFSGSFSVEVVPCFQVGFYSQKYRIADTNSGGKWKEVDPVGESAALTKSNKEASGNTVRLIKMLKCWKRYCAVQLKSFHIEILAQNFLASYQYKDKSSIYYDWMIRDFLSWLSNKHSSWGNSVTHPSTYESIDIGGDWKSKTDSALARAKKAIEYGKSNMPYSAKEEWQKIFGNDFSG